MGKICNFTRHPPTMDHFREGVYNPPDTVWLEVRQLLEFNSLECAQIEKSSRSRRLAEIALECVGNGGTVMIGGPPFFMSYLERALKDVGVDFVYSFPYCISIEETLAEGIVKKIAINKHEGFV